MSLTDFIAIIALLVSAGALFLSAYQTWLTRESLLAAKYALDLSRKQEHLGLLPRMHFILDAKVKMENWLKILSEAEGIMNRALEAKDPHLLPQLERLGLDTPKDMIDKFMYEKSPEWLSTLLVTAAQYHYTTACNFRSLSRFKDDETYFSFTADLLNRCRESISAIKEILGYLEDMIPDVVLNSPASINDDKFLTD